MLVCVKNQFGMSSKCVFPAGDRKLRPLGPARFHRLGAQEHPLFRWRPWKHHHLWRVSRWCKCQLPGKDKIFYSAEVGYVNEASWLAILLHFKSEKKKIQLDLTAFCSANVLVVQILSPYNKGLVKRAISQSGAALCPWARSKQPLKIAQEVCDCHIWSKATIDIHNCTINIMAARMHGCIILVAIQIICVNQLHIVHEMTTYSCTSKEHLNIGSQTQHCPKRVLSL